MKTERDLSLELDEVKSQIRRLKKFAEQDWINKVKLKECGFTEGAIVKFLGNPCKHVKIRTMYGNVVNSAYTLERVNSIMQTQTFQEWFNIRKNKKNVVINHKLIKQLFPNAFDFLCKDINILESDVEINQQITELIIQQDDLRTTLEGMIALRTKEEDGLKRTLAIKKAEIESMLDLKNYEKSFHVARALGRQIIGVFGDTNSGKTHKAYLALKLAKSGCYLAPLRLLALEIYERLNADGVPCNLLTGEEKIIVENAQHTACTIEMCQFQMTVDVAVIDECQMLFDADRGSAWSAALIGVPALVVYAIGSPTVENTIVSLANMLNERLVIEHTQRLVPLMHTSEPIKLKHIQQGDAVIAFSRKEVLKIAQSLASRGYSVATIYGALSPEVRKLQVHKFITGSANVVVATDAIGMGLNLPIKRVIFSADSKYDGERVRKLKRTECVQIAGRAGRFLFGEIGEYAGVNLEIHRHVVHMLNTKMSALQGAVMIRPTIAHIQKLYAYLQPPKSRELDAILDFFTKHTALDNKVYKIDSLQNMKYLAQVVDRFPQISIEDKFALVCAPLEYNSTCFSEYSDWVRKLAKNQLVALPELPEWLNQKVNRSQLNAAEQLSKVIGLYAWISYKFPLQFIDVDLIVEARAKVSTYIDDVLSMINNNKVKTNI